MKALTIQNVRTRPEWEKIITTDWRKSLEGIIQTGRDLISAKLELSNGEFQKMIRAGLPFGKSTANALMRIARSKAITSDHPGGRLPHGYAVLGQLASLSVEDFRDAQERGLIGVDTSKKKAKAVRRAYKGPVDGAVGEGAEVAGLPSPKEAREVARATKRMVAASDGNLYSGSTEEEGAEYVRRREQTYAVIDAIKAISESGVSPKEWCDQAKDHWLVELEFGRIDGAIAWLTEFRFEVARQKLVFDLEVKADGK